VLKGIAEPRSHFVQLSSYLKAKSVGITQYDMTMPQEKV